MAKAVDEIGEAAEALRARCPETPEVGLLPEVGLDGIVERMVPGTVIRVPGDSRVGVAAEWVLGQLAGSVAVAWYSRAGRPAERAAAVRVMKALGVGTLVVTAGAWGLNGILAKGDLMVVSDHINALGDNPLIGPADSRFGVRFPDMSRPYSPRLMEAAAAAAWEQGAELHRGVYLATSGAVPGTVDDRRLWRLLGADAVGPGMAAEALVAAQGGQELLALAAVMGPERPEAAGVGTMEEKAEGLDRFASVSASDGVTDLRSNRPQSTPIQWQTGVVPDLPVIIERIIAVVSKEPS